MKGFGIGSNRGAYSWRAALVGATLGLAPQSGVAQSEGSGRAGERDLLPVQREIILARSAAPSSVSAEATIWILAENGYEVAVEGTNGSTCFVGRAWLDSLEPFCFDEEGTRTIFPISRLRNELYHRGVEAGEVQRIVAQKLHDGEFSLPTRPAMGYMLSSAQQLISDDGRPVGNWNPHLMIYFPYLTPESMGLPAVPDGGKVFVVDPGKPLSNLLVIMEDFVDPVPNEPSGR